MKTRLTGKTGTPKGSILCSTQFLWLYSVRDRACIFTVALCICVAVSASFCYAAPPAKDACDQYSDVYDKLKCKHDAVATQIEYMAGTVFAEGTALGNQLTPGQRGQMASVKQKTQFARNNGASDDFKRLAKSESKSNGQPCHLVPLTVDDDENDDGICDYEQGIGKKKNAQCAAIDLDANGTLQACNPDKKNKGKGKGGLECDQICDQTNALTNDEDTAMQAQAAQMDTAYDSLGSDLYDLNGDLDTLNSIASQPVVSAAVYDCSNIPSPTPDLVLTTGILRQVSVTARGLAGVANTGCQQTAVALGFGGNGSAVCAVFQTAATVLEVAYTTADAIRLAEAGELSNATLACLQQMKGNMDDKFTTLMNQHSQIMENDNNNATVILNKLEQLKAELVTFLCTPQGLRSCFPIK